MSVAPSAPPSPPPSQGKPPAGGAPGGQPRPPAAAGLRLAAYFLRYLYPVRGLVILLAVGTALTALAHLPLALLPMQLTLHFDDRPYLTGYLIFVLAVVAAGWVLGVLIGYVNAYVGEFMLRSLRHQVFGNLERLSMQSVYSQGPGQFVQQLGRDAFIVRDLFQSTVFNSAGDIASGVVALATMLWLDPWLTLVVVACFAATAWLIRVTNLQVEINARRGRAPMQEILSRVVENVGGFRDIVAAGRFSGFLQQFDVLLKDSQRVNVRTTLWAQVSGLVPGMMLSLLIVSVYYIGLECYQSVSQVGEIITYAGLLSWLFPAIQAVARMSTSLALTVPSMASLRETLDQPEDPDKAAATPLKETIRSIRFDHMSLELENRRIIDDMCFELPAGRFTAIVGQSGSGKTTLFHLMLRLMEPTAGAILVNDRPLRSYTMESLRTRIGFIPQAPFIFNDNLRENILLATPDKVSPEQLARAVEQSQLGEVVARRQHEGGLDAVAGYMGNRLSGGEKQRVALARLLLRDPEVIICDEYTANVDVKTARLIHESMRTRFAGRTRVVITHELYAARGAGLDRRNRQGACGAAGHA